MRQVLPFSKLFKRDTAQQRSHPRLAASRREGLEDLGAFDDEWNIGVSLSTALFQSFAAASSTGNAARSGADTAIERRRSPGRLPLLRGVVKH